MILKNALKILNINGHLTRKKVTEHYRDLVKLYHPDTNPDQSEWAHGKMVELNEAYRILLKRISTLNTKVKVEKNQAGPRTYTSDGPVPPPDPQGPLSHPLFQKYLPLSQEKLSEGLSLYFHYGLNNPDLRAEGTRRFRYRSSLNNMRSGLEILKKLKKHPLSTKEKQVLASLEEFSRLYFHVMQFYPIRIPPSENREYKVWKFFNEASDMIDEGIRESFFPNSAPLKFGRLSPEKKLNLAGNSYIRILMDFPETIFTDEINQRITLIEASLNLLEMRASGRFVIQP